MAGKSGARALPRTSSRGRTWHCLGEIAASWLKLPSRLLLRDSATRASCTSVEHVGKLLCCHEVSSSAQLESFGSAERGPNPSVRCSEGGPWDGISEFRRIGDRRSHNQLFAAGAISGASFGSRGLYQSTFAGAGGGGHGGLSNSLWQAKRRGFYQTSSSIWSQEDKPDTSAESRSRTDFSDDTSELQHASISPESAALGTDTVLGSTQCSVAATGDLSEDSAKTLILRGSEKEDSKVQDMLSGETEILHGSDNLHLLEERESLHGSDNLHLTAEAASSQELCTSDGSEEQEIEQLVPALVASDDQPSGEEKDDIRFSAKDFGSDAKIGDSIPTALGEQEDSKEELRPGFLPGVPPGDFDVGALLDEVISTAKLERRKKKAPEKEEDGVPREVPLEKQRSLTVGIVGPPNSGKSVLTNILAGRKVSAVSRKTNTTRREILGTYTRGDLQVLFYDTPGMAQHVFGHPLKRLNREIVTEAWRRADECDVVLVVIDAGRQLSHPDPRVGRLMRRLAQDPPFKGHFKALCLNKIDTVKEKSNLLKLAEDFGKLPGFDAIFMISGMRQSGIREIREYLDRKGVVRPWEEPATPKYDVTAMQNLAMEVVREHMLDHLHEEVPYKIQHNPKKILILKDKSVLIAQDIIVQTTTQRMIVVGKKGACIGRIGIRARMELEKILGQRVHLLLDVKLAKKHGLQARS